MAFGTYGNNKVESSDRPQIDWAALNSYVVEAAGLQDEATLVGTISSLIDLGIQPQEDAQLEWTGTPEEEAEEIQKNPNTYFEDLFDYQDKKTKRYKRFPVKAAQSVALTVDFGDILVDKAKFFGDSNPLPLRLLLGSDFTPKGGVNIVAKPLSLTIRKNDKTGNQWSFPFNHTLYKMAVAAKVVKQGDPFVPNDIDKLLGKALQFKARVYLKDDKYFTEKCSFVGALARGQAAVPIDESLLSIIQFNEENDATQIKNLRASVKNTIRKALNFDESKIKDQIGEGFKKDDALAKGNSDKSSSPKKEEPESQESDFDPEEEFNIDEQIPF